MINNYYFLLRNVNIHWEVYCVQCTGHELVAVGSGGLNQYSCRKVFNELFFSESEFEGGPLVAMGAQAPKCSYASGRHWQCMIMINSK